MKSIELFAGVGGLGIGVSQAGFNNEITVECDRWCCETLQKNKSKGIKNLRDWTIENKDARYIDYEQYQDKIHLVSGGPPCQPFSLGGKHQGRGDNRDMFPTAVDVVRQTRPFSFIFENVKGLTRSSFANYFQYINLQLCYPEIILKRGENWIDHLSRLENHATKGHHKGLHYRVVSRVLNAADYGVPQRRERVFLVGFRGDLGIEWHFPEGEYSKEALHHAKASGDYWERLSVSSKERAKLFKPMQKCVQSSKKPWRTVREAISDLPDPEVHSRKSKRWPNHEFQPGARAYKGHTGSPLDEPAKTLKAGVHGVPGGENMLRRSNDTLRYFTVRESARLQTFPDEFVFHGSWSKTVCQLGNAVPVELARILAYDIYQHLLQHEHLEDI